MRKTIPAILIAIALPSAAHAAPGMGTEVYGASVNAGELEAETRYDRLAGGADDGEDVIQIEASYGISSSFSLGIQAEFEKEPGAARKAEELGVEAIWALGRAGGFDIALYGEYEIVFDGTDEIETKLLLQHRRGPLDLRLNLIAAKELDSSERVELGYAFSADYEVFDEIRLGVQGFGELGGFDRFLPRAEHFIGPVAKFEIEALGPEVELEAGYLFALGAARDDTKGQLRIGLEFEF